MILLLVLGSEGAPVAGAQTPQPKAGEKPVELPPLDPFLLPPSLGTDGRPRAMGGDPQEKTQEPGFRQEQRLREVKEAERMLGDGRPTPTWKLVLMGAVIVVAGVLVLTLGIHMGSRKRL